MNPVISTAWLAERQGDPKLVVLDATWLMPGTPRDAAKEYAERHIPGAVFFDIDAVANHATDLPHMLPSPAEFATAVRRMGVEADSEIVIYDSEGIMSAPRVWWEFRVMGHDAVHVLDGGLKAWLAEGRPVEVGWPEPPPHGEFKSHFRPELVRDIAAVRGLVDSRAEQIIDARSGSRFKAEAPEPRAGLRSGHMPGARNVPFGQLLTADGTLAAPEAIKAAFEAAGVDLGKPIVTSCGSGITASVLALGLAAIGRDDVAVYDGSWTEWGGRADTPIATGPAD